MKGVYCMVTGYGKVYAQNTFDLLAFWQLWCMATCNS